MRFVFHFAEKTSLADNNEQGWISIFFPRDWAKHWTTDAILYFLWANVQPIIAFYFYIDRWRNDWFFLNAKDTENEKSSMLSIVHLFFPFQRFRYNTFKLLLYRKKVDFIRTWEQTGERFWCLAQHLWLFLGNRALFQIKIKFCSKNYANERVKKTLTVKWFCLANDPLKQATDTKVGNQKNQR